MHNREKVYFNKPTQKWHAKVYPKNHEPVFLGRFESEEDANDAVEIFLKKNLPVWKLTRKPGFVQNKKDLTLEEARSRLHYDPVTGILTWRGILGTHVGLRLKNDTVAGWIASEKNRQWRCVSLNNRAYKAHILIWFLFFGVWPNERIIHRNGNALDNRIENLALVSTIKEAKAMNKKLKKGIK